MKTAPLSLITALLGALPAMSAVIPVQEDSYTTATTGVITPGAGRASSLTVSRGNLALLRFGAGDFAGLVTPATLGRARLVFYVKSAQKAGDLNVHAVNSEWTETAATAQPSPAYDHTPLATVPAEQLRAGSYITVDVTDLAKLWLETPATDFGIALAGTEAINLQISSKEGAATGHAAWLEIESKPAITDDQVVGGIDATKIGDGTVSNQELAYLHGVVSPLQDQITTINTSLTMVSADSVSKAGDTMTGDLTVKGDVKVGLDGDLFASSSEENLRIVRGKIHHLNDGSMTIMEGKGFTVGAVDERRTKITFTRAFSGMPVITTSLGYPDGNTSLYEDSFKIVSSTTASATLYIDFASPNADYYIYFIAAGPR